MNTTVDKVISAQLIMLVHSLETKDRRSITLLKYTSKFQFRYCSIRTSSCQLRSYQIQEPFHAFSAFSRIRRSRCKETGRFPFDRKFRLKFEWNTNFRKFVSKISVHLSRLPFFLEFRKFRKFSVPLGISTRFESDPVPLVVKSYKMAESLSSLHYTRCKMICHSSSLFLIENENVRI